MTDVVIILLLLVILAFAIKGAGKRLKGGCCGGGKQKKIKPADRNLSHYPHKYTVYIGGMTCDHCKKRVENEFNSVNGCCAKVDLSRGVAELWSKNEMTNGQIEAVVKKNGYDFGGVERKA